MFLLMLSALSSTGQSSMPTMPKSMNVYEEPGMLKCTSPDFSPENVTQVEGNRSHLQSHRFQKLRSPNGLSPSTTVAQKLQLLSKLCWSKKQSNWSNQQTNWNNQQTNWSNQ